MTQSAFFLKEQISDGLLFNEMKNKLKKFALNHEHGMDETE